MSMEFARNLLSTYPLGILPAPMTAASKSGKGCGPLRSGDRVQLLAGSDLWKRHTDLRGRAGMVIAVGYSHRGEPRLTVDFGGDRLVGLPCEEFVRV